ncbi:hypothetical protein FBUS_00299 [Fasciolopsis buskii]|uniref:Uncharacterized protein n=1 Tax=Fasciolopsis buskii TaxID=27845 RepID=A0A8E0RNS0_9TREM|nr:hypothetical protein FBUS_00299 [Fasciolopsis buski]
MANLTFPHLAALNMDVANRLSEQINQLMKQPGRIDRKLKAAIDLYKKRILELKSIALLEDNCGLAEIYHDSVDLIERISQFNSSVKSAEERFNNLSASVLDIYQSAKPYIDQCDLARTKLHMSQLKDYIAFYDSRVDAARLLDDDELLVACIRDYINFVHREVQLDQECLPIILQEASSIENCLDRLKGLIVKFESLLEDISFPVVPFGCLEKEDPQAWEDEQLQEFTIAFKRLVSIEIPYPLIACLS